MADGIVAEVEYRDIPGFEGYRAGSDGTIWSCWRNGGAKIPKGDWRILKPKKHIRSDHKYVTTKFRRDAPVHQLILFAFVGPKPDGMECRHLNGKASDNRIKNLAWGTRRENVHDAIRHGTFVATKPSIRKIRKREKENCSVDGCNKPFYAKGFCENHYQSDYKRRKKEGFI